MEGKIEFINKLVSVSEIEVEGLAWRLLHHQNSPYLALESRNLEERKVQFGMIDLRNDQKIWGFKSLKEEWWVSISELNEENLTIQEIDPESTMPVALKTYALSTQDGQMIWEKEGNVPLESSNTLTDQHLISRYSTDNPHYPTLKKLIQQYLNVNTEQEIHYREYEEKIIIIFHLEGESKIFSRYLWILDANDGKTLYINILDKDSQGISFDGGLIAYGKLIVVKEKRLICLLNLNKISTN